MIWREIFLNKSINKNDLIGVFAELFNTDASKINLIDNVTDFRENDILTCVVDRWLGDFCLRLDCFVNFQVENEFNVISRLCAKIESRALISDDDKDNPYCFILFEASGQIKIVEINSQLFDEHNELKIIKEMPYSHGNPQEV
jgi:hypothetical protein